MAFRSLSRPALGYEQVFNLSASVTRPRIEGEQQFFVLGFVVAVVLFCVCLFYPVTYLSK
jgi:hypothetical protein